MGLQGTFGVGGTLSGSVSQANITQGTIQSSTEINGTLYGNVSYPQTINGVIQQSYESGALSGSVAQPSTIKGDVQLPDVVYGMNCERDYLVLNNKPSINNKTLIGNMSLQTIGVDNLIHEEICALTNEDIEALIGGV